MGLEYGTYVAWEIVFPLAMVGVLLLGSTLFMIVMVLLKYRIPSLQGVYSSLHSPLLGFFKFLYGYQQFENESSASQYCLLISIFPPLLFVALVFSNAFLFRVVFSCAPGFDCFSLENKTLHEPIDCNSHENMENVTKVICYKFVLDSFNGIVALGGSVVFLLVLCKCVRQPNICCSFTFRTLLLFGTLLYVVTVELWRVLTNEVAVGKFVFICFVYAFTCVWLTSSPYKQKHQAQIGRSEESGGDMVGTSPQGSGASGSTPTEQQPLLSTSKM